MTNTFCFTGYLPPTPERRDLRRETWDLIQTARNTATFAEQICLPETNEALAPEQISELISTRRTVNNLVAAANSFRDEADSHLAHYITNLAVTGHEPWSDVKHMLWYFNPELKSISRRVVNSSSNNDGQVIVREILERCYMESVNPLGWLDCEGYHSNYAQRDSWWSYDPYTQHHEYESHEKRLEADQIYATEFDSDCDYQRKMRARNEAIRREAWADVWVQALNNYPGGPTLFTYNPRSSPKRLPSRISQHLFRAFDKSSTGHSDETVVASTASISGKNCRVSLLSRPDGEAAQMVYRHMIKDNWKKKKENASDNLMSWSSSLLRVIQYAIWRCSRSLTPDAPEPVMICAVDTTKFPEGQFASGMDLLRTYRQTAEVSKDFNMRALFKHRLTTPEFDNGEFFTQGVVHHAGRSCTFSFDELVDAGLYDLYPELGEESGTTTWAKRVKELRQEWSPYTPPYKTDSHDVNSAIRLARECFQGLHERNMALMLLAFRNRELKVVKLWPFVDFEQETQQSLDRYQEYGPQEVRRYMRIAEQIWEVKEDTFNFPTLFLHKFFGTQ